MNLKGTRPEHFGTVSAFLYRRFAERTVEGLYATVAAEVPPGDLTLDLGCGTGRLAEVLAERAGAGGGRIVGVDPERAMLRQARDRARRGRIVFVRADGGDLPFAGGTFDLALATLALHHWEEPEEIVQEVRRVLSPGGRFVVVEPDPEAPEEGWREPPAGLRGAGRFRLTALLLRRAFRTHGFTARECDEVLRPLFLRCGFRDLAHRRVGWFRILEASPDPDRVPVAWRDEPARSGSEVVRVPIGDELDLHTFAPRDAAAAAEAYLDAAAESGRTLVRIVHGRGIGVAREIVRGVCARHPAVIEFGDAPPGSGGWGATVVRLRSGSTT